MKTRNGVYYYNIQSHRTFPKILYIIYILYTYMLIYSESIRARTPFDIMPSLETLGYNINCICVYIHRKFRISLI